MLEGGRKRGHLYLVPPTKKAEKAERYVHPYMRSISGRIESAVARCKAENFTRKGKNISQAAVARRCRLTPGGLSELISGTRAPGPSTLIKVAEGTDCSLFWLMTGQGPQGRYELNLIEKTGTQ